MLATAIPGLSLRKLVASDAPEIFALVRANQNHLTKMGDYRDLVAASFEHYLDELSAPNMDGLRWGIVAEGRLVGRIDLVPVEPARYGLGYWLAEAATGKGYATAAVYRLAQFAGETLGATHIYAGVTHGNAKSVAVLSRAGFAPVEQFETYTRFHLALVTV
jgi:RimJ/RimL family protein N-acetyltransferase